MPFFYLSDLCIIGITYLFMTSFENAIHKASHYKISGPLYRWHKIHHKDYPVIKLESDTYIDSTGYLENWYLWTIFGSSLIIYSVSASRTSIIYSTEVIVYMNLVDYLHKQFHLKHSWLKNYKWFQKQKQLHLLHHIKQDTNFSFINHSYDKLSNTHFSDRERFNTVISNS
jgi:hypothetical protein